MSVLIIPGFFQKKEYYNFLSGEIQRAGFDTEIADLGLNIKGLEDASGTVNKYIIGNSRKYDIIAHSFGGIILKYILATRPEVRKSISSITFVAVPHGGSWQALFLAMVPAARELLPISKKVKELAKVSLPQETVNFLPESELKIWPRKGGLLREHIDIVIPDTNHDNIINNAEFISKAIIFIKSGHDRVFL